MNGSLSMYASPIDFNKNDKLDNKINEMKKQKLNLDMLTKFKQQQKNEKQVENIHKNIKEENDDTLAEFYDSELNQQMNKERMMREFVEDKTITNDYMISNNLEMNRIPGSERKNNKVQSDKDILEKLNYIITMFEEQKHTKTTQKNEEIVLYCFLGFFMIYVLDSFVKIGKYSRA